MSFSCMNSWLNEGQSLSVVFVGPSGDTVRSWGTFMVSFLGTPS